MLPHVISTFEEPAPGDVSYLITPHGAYRVEKFRSGEIRIDAPSGKAETLHGLATTLLQAFPDRLASVGGRKGRIQLFPK